MPSKIGKPNGEPAQSDPVEDPADEFVKLMTQMKLPVMPDMGAFMAAHSRNMEALAASLRIAVEGAEAIAKRQIEMMQQTLTDLTDCMRSLSTTNGQQTNGAGPVECGKRAYEHAVSNALELAEVVQRSNRNVLDHLHRRAIAAMAEMGSLLEKSPSGQ
jgi:phasin family protein